MATCKHLGKKIGTAECGCAGLFSVYTCKLLESVALPYSAEPQFLHHNDGHIEPNPEILLCNNCQHNTTKTQSYSLPKKCD